MNTDEIIRMAQECQLIGTRPHLDGIYQQSLVRFAALVAAAEREACAMEAEYEAARWPYAPESREPCESIAKGIRARGNE